MKRYLKLTGGSFTGRKLYVPDIGVRPATNLVREAIFSTLESMLEDGIRGLKLLDLFAGTGSLGLEALSRGAESVTFVDNSVASVKSIRKNLELLSFKGQVIKSDVISFLKRNKSLDYDIIFFDPPYKYEKVSEALKLLAESVSYNKNPVIVYERAFKKELPSLDERFCFIKRRKYGQTEVLYYRLNKKT